MTAKRLAPFVALSAATMMLVACTTTGSETPQPTPQELAATPAAAALGPDEVLSRIGALRAQALAAGECGLFLWLKRDDAPLVFFQTSDGAATMVVDGVPTKLTRGEVSRTIAYQFFERQAFTHGDITIDVAVTPEAKRSLQRGLKLPAGSLAIRTGQDWSAVLPVAGVIGCK